MICISLYSFTFLLFYFFTFLPFYFYQTFIRLLITISLTKSPLRVSRRWLSASSRSPLSISFLAECRA